MTIVSRHWNISGTGRAKYGVCGAFELLWRALKMYCLEVSCSFTARDIKNRWTAVFQKIDWTPHSLFWIFWNAYLVFFCIQDAYLLMFNWCVTAHLLCTQTLQLSHTAAKRLPTCVSLEVHSPHCGPIVAQWHGELGACKRQHRIDNTITRPTFF